MAETEVIPPLDLGPGRSPPAPRPSLHPTHGVDATANPRFTGSRSGGHARAL